MKSTKNSPRIEFTDLFNKQRKKAPLEVKNAFREALALFFEDQSHPHLRNHPLKRKLAGYRSINVTDDWRALFKATKAANQIVITFYQLGTHEKLYKNETKD